MGIENPSDLTPKVWKQVGGHWNAETEGASTFYDKFWNDPVYSDRTSHCFLAYGEDEEGEERTTTYEEEMGQFEEYCTNPCGCDDDKDEDVQTADTEGNNINLNGDDAGIKKHHAWYLYGILTGIAIVFVVRLIVFAVRRVSNKMGGSKKGGYMGTSVHEDSDLIDSPVTPMAVTPIMAGSGTMDHDAENV